MCSLPEDLVEAVLARLPVQSVIKLRRVSKSWRALIDSPEFSKLHLSLGGSSRSHKKLILGTRRVHPDESLTHLKQGRIRYYTRILVTDFDSPDKALTSMLELPDPFRPLQYIKAFHGCCNGLLCLTPDQDSTVVVLWNPYVSGLIWRLPSSPFPKVEGLPDILFRNPLAYYGFGYDEANDDYKVVRLVEFCGNSQVKIYSLRSNSWSTVAPRFPYAPASVFRSRGFFSIGNRCSNAGVLANNAVHWLMEDCRLERLIVGVDLRTEELNFAPKPPQVPAKEEYELGVLDGCLCVISGYNNLERLFFDMWVMKHYGMEESWTKKIVQLPIPRSGLSGDIWVRPIAYSESRSNQVAVQGCDHFMWYDIEENKLARAASLPGSTAPVSFMSDGYHFIGSLVRPYGGTSAQIRGTKRIKKELSGEKANKSKKVEQN